MLKLKYFVFIQKKIAIINFQNKKINYKTSLIITFNATFNVTEEKLPNESLGK